MSETTARETNPILRLAIELGPLAVFFVANARAGIYVATGAFMVAIVISLAASVRIERRVPIMPLVTAVFVLVFGALTFWLRDETFIKIKPTIVNLLFAAALLVGLALKRPLLKPLLGASLQLDEEGWRRLTLRWGLWFLALAALNELVWRNTSTEFWAGFRLFGLVPLSIVFMLTQMGLIKRHMVGEA